MTTERWRKVEELYQATYDLDSGARGAFLTEACGGDRALRKEIEALLAQNSGNDLLHRPASQSLAELLSGRPLFAGDKLGPYEIIARIGAGGMGEVWKARDTRLGRLVAIKTSRERFSGRFEREAKAIAALNHPHICQIYDVGPDYLVMEYVEGSPLQGPLPLDRVLTFAAQLAAALDAAHRAGIVHRDLKPSNVLMSKSGVKLLDFGLAEMEPAGDGKGEHPPAQEGALIGTLHYMAPEQLQGKKADERSDIFGFGCMLYEMVTGKRAFDGPDVPSVVAAISAGATLSVAAMAPAALDRVLRRCLANDPEDRWQSARDLQPQLEWIAAGIAESAPRRGGWRAVYRPVVAGLLMGAMIAGWAFWFGFGRRLGEGVGASIVRFTIAPPVGLSFALAGHGPARISPDGSHLFFLASSNSGNGSLWLRRMDEQEAHALAGTEGAHFPFWSGDGLHVGFFADGKLKRVSIDGGSPQTICAAAAGRGGAWHGGADGVIVFAPGNRERLWRVSAAGGEPVAITTLDSATQEISHRVPHFLPDGRHFLYLSVKEDAEKSAILVGELPGGETPRAAGDKRLLGGNTEASWVRSNTGGYLLFVREGNLMAQPFDESRLELRGEPVSIVESIDTGGIRSTGAYSASNSGVLVYRKRPPTSRRLAWLDREGKEVGQIAAGENLTGIALAPDGRVAGNKEDANGVHNVWLIDRAHAAASRLTFEARSAINPVWSPDGKRIAYSVARGRGYDLFAKDTEGRRDAELLVESDLGKNVLDWSRDGKWILYSESVGVRSRLLVLPVTGDRKPILLDEFKMQNSHAKFSPDGSYFVFCSDESGRSEVYVRAFSPGSRGKGGKWQISADGGSHPIWRADGKELYFRGAGGKLMAAPVLGAGGVFQAGKAIELFDLRGAIVTPRADGQRFLAELASPALAQEPLHVVLNWAAALARLRGK